ncbi:MAG: peptidoglycan-binding protein, partial [Rhizobiaceae bacterium]
MQFLKHSIIGLSFLGLGFVPPVTASAQSVELISTLVSAKAVRYSGRSFPTRNLKSTYEARGYTPIWLTNGQLNDEGNALLNEIKNAYRDGLDPSEYLGGLTGFSNIETDEDAARLELALSYTYLTLGRDLFSGITTPSVTDPNIIIKRKKIDAAQWLEGVSSAGVVAMYRALRPGHPQYAQLRQMLGGYRSLLLRGGWAPISKGGTLKPGMNEPRVNEMRLNLTARGYDLGTELPELYDDGLVEAMKHFQKRHGLTPDGVAGPNTFKALSVSAQSRVKQIAINLERWRWLPRNLGQSHILVNQAGFELFMIKKGKTVDNRRVIVGKPFHQSPMFSGKIAYAEFNPTWTVPLSIAGKEMLPKIRSNPTYLQDKGYLVYKGWGKNAKPINTYA